MTTTNPRTLESLTALPNTELDRLAVEKVMGWTYRETCEHDEPAYSVKSNFQPSPESVCFWETKALVSHWHPTTNRNQSGQLLQAMAERGVLFDIGFGHHAPDERHPHVEAYQPSETPDHWQSENRWLVHVPGNGARSEVIASWLVRGHPKSMASHDIHYRC